MFTSVFHSCGKWCSERLGNLHNITERGRARGCLYNLCFAHSLLYCFLARMRFLVFSLVFFLFLGSVFLVGDERKFCSVSNFWKGWITATPPFSLGNLQSMPINEAQEAEALGGGPLLLVQAPQARRSVDPSKKIFFSIKGKSYWSTQRKLSYEIQICSAFLRMNLKWAKQHSD